MQERIFNLLELVIPASLVLYAVFLTLKSTLGKLKEIEHEKTRSKNIEITLPLKLQAYERICLFLERITPINLIPRVNEPNYSSRNLQQALLTEIRQEYNHNISQQIYLEKKSWMLVRSSMEELVMTINDAAAPMEEESTALDLARAIFDKYMNQSQDIIALTLDTLKDEIQKDF